MLGVEELYHRYRDDVFRYLCSLTHDPAQAEELLSETFLCAIQKAGSFRGEGSAKTWLFGIARNVWLESLRRRRPQLDLDDLIDWYLADELAADTDARAMLARVRALLAQKDERSRRILYLRAEGYSYAEIARMLSTRQNTARGIEHRPRTWPKAPLQKEGYWDTSK